MNSLEIFLTQVLMSVFVFALSARWFVAPWLSKKSTSQALIILIAPHALRHLGLSFLVPSVASGDIPIGFANMAAYGDLLSGLLALLALVALRRSWGLALLIVAVFNLVGFVDLLNALRHAEAIPYLVATWFIPTLFVPLLLVSHVMIFIRLSKANYKQGELL